MFSLYPNPDTTQYKPVIPYYGLVPSMTSGSIIIVFGRVPYGSKRFTFDFLTGSVINEHMKTYGDIAFHFNVRFDEQAVVRNNRKCNNWGPEERNPKAMPFMAGKEFEAMILVEDSGYKVAVNGKHFIDFCHRMPVSSVGVFSISGDVVIDRIEFRRENRYQPHSYQTPPAVNPSLTPVFNPPLPYYHMFGGGLREGSMIYISGRLNSSPDRFAIDFCCGAQPFSDIAFHLGVRYRESVVVRNTFQNNNWGPEERTIPHFPFSAGVNFDMIIRVESNRFMVAVNGQHFLQYMHRIPISCANVLKISGDIIVASVRFAQS